MSRLSAFASMCLLLLGGYSAMAQLEVPNIAGGLKDAGEDLGNSIGNIVTSPDPLGQAGKEVEGAVTGTVNNINLRPKQHADWSEFYFKNNSNLPVLVWVHYYRYLGDAGNVSTLQVVDESNGWSMGGPWLVNPGEEKYLTATSGRYIYVHAEAELKKGFVASRDWSGKYAFKTGKNSQRNFFKLDLGSTWNEMHFSINENVSVRRAQKPSTSKPPTDGNGGGSGKINGGRDDQPAQPSNTNAGRREVRHKIFSDNGVVVEGDHLDNRLQSERQIGQAEGRMLNDGRWYWVYGNLPPVLQNPGSRESERVIKWMIRPDGTVMQGSFIDDNLVKEYAINKARLQRLSDGRVYWVFQDLEPVLRQ